MALVVVQAVGADFTASPFNSPYASNILAGSLCFAVSSWIGSGSTCAITDNNGGIWTPLGSPLTGAGVLSNFRTQFFYAANHNAGATTVTATTTPGVDTNLGLLEISGASTSAPFDAGPTYQNVVSANPANTALATVAADTIVVSYALFGDTPGAPAVDAPFLQDLLATLGNNPLAHRIVSSAGSYSATFHQGSATNATLGIVSFKSPTAATPGLGDNPPFGFSGRGAGW